MTTAAPAPRLRTFTRDDVVRLGQAGKPWEYLPIALQGLRQSPGDIGLRLLTASNFARLGLRTAALDQLSLVPDQVVQTPEITALIRVLQAMPSDAVSDRVAVCRANVEALGDRGPGTGDAFQRWAANAHLVVVCRASDGNVIHRPASGDADSWLGLSDQRTAAATLVRDHIAPPHPDADRPVYLEGVDPPWLLKCLVESRPRQSTGHTPPVTILQADPDQFFHGLSLANFTECVSRPSIRAMVGKDATLRLRAFLEERSLYHIAGPAITTLLTRERLSPPLSEVLPVSLRRQEDLMISLKRRADDEYRGRDAAWWRKRFTAALGGGEPLRVLVPTTRYSTFVQHASGDLVRSIETLGHRARLFIEPDDATRFAAPAYLKEILDFRPDLIVLINYPRGMLAEALPANIPFVCWVQDAMPHLFDKSLGSSLGALDFIVGHLFPELFKQHGYPESRSMAVPIVADERKFHPGPAPSRYACEIAYVSHQSESPAAQHDRLRSEFGPAVAPAIDRLRPLIEREVLKPLSELKVVQPRELVVEALRGESGREPEARLVDVITRSYCQPHMDRLIRHQTLHWAADIADRRGWRLRVYGNGWDKHPRFAPFASGPLDHGDDLRSSYHEAAVHLHVMSHALVHQRLIECILSGGFPLCRLHAPERWTLIECLGRLGVREGAQPLDIRDPAMPMRTRVACWADAPSLMQLASSMQRLGIFDEVFQPYGGSRIGPVIDEREWLTPETLEAHDPDLWSAFGMLGRNEQFMFHSPESFEQRIEFVLNRPDQREVLSAAARRRFLDRFTYEGFARRLLSFVRDRLGK